MSKRLTIAFADAAAGVSGIAIEGVGTLVATPAGVRALPEAEPAPRAHGGFDVRGVGELELELADGARGCVGGVAIDGRAAVLPLGAGAALARAVGVFLDGVTVALSATRPDGARGHGEEAVRSTLVEGDPPLALSIDDARLSTTYDRDGLVRHFGVELWEGEESEFARRLAGEARAHGELRRGGTLARVAFLDCHGDGGRRGPGVYAIVARLS